MKGTVKISTTNLRYKTIYRCKIVSAGKYKGYRQPEVSIWPPNRKKLHIWNSDRSRLNSNAKFGIFGDAQLHRRLAKSSRQRSTTRNWRIGEQNVYFRLSLVVAIDRGHFFRSGRTPDLPSELQWYLSYCRRYKYFRFGWPYCYFRLSVNVAFICEHFLWVWRVR